MIAILVLSLIAWAGIEIFNWQNTIGIGGLVWKSAVLGLCFGALIAYRLSLTIKDEEDKIRIYAFSLFGGAILFITASSFMNRAMFKGNPVQKPVTFIRQEVFGASRFGQLQDSIVADGYYLIFTMDGKNKEHKVKLTHPFPTPAKGEQIFIPIREGFLGIDIVDLR